MDKYWSSWLEVGDIVKSNAANRPNPFPNTSGIAESFRGTKKGEEKEPAEAVTPRILSRYCSSDSSLPHLDLSIPRLRRQAAIVARLSMRLEQAKKEKRLQLQTPSPLASVPSGGNSSNANANEGKANESEGILRPIPIRKSKVQRRVAKPSGEVYIIPCELCKRYKICCEKQKDRRACVKCYSRKAKCMHTDHQGDHRRQGDESGLDSEEILRSKQKPCHPSQEGRPHPLKKYLTQDGGIQTVIQRSPGDVAKDSVYEQGSTGATRRRTYSQAMEKTNPEHADELTHEGSAKKQKTNGVTSNLPENSQSSDTLANEDISPGRGEQVDARCVTPVTRDDPAPSGLINRTISGSPEPKYKSIPKGGIQQKGNTGFLGGTRNTPVQPFQTDKKPTMSTKPTSKPTTSFVREPSIIILDNELDEFLAGLRFDFCDWSSELRAKGLTSKKELLAMSKWEEKQLDKILAKLVPTMPELHRYVLAEGITGLIP